MSQDATIRVLPLDGVWERIGSDRLRGLVPESIEASSDDWGPSSMSFRLAAEEGARRPDLLPYSPIELEVGGLLVWSGFVWQRPAEENSYAVTCRGWQYHLDDDLLDRCYVHSRLGDYRDQRSFLGAALSDFTVAGVVSNDIGAIMLGWPNGAVIVTGNRVGVTLDLGPDSVGKRVVISWVSTNNVAWQFVVRGTDGESSEGTGESIITQAMNGGASGTNAGSFSTSRRYIHVYVQATSGSTINADVHLRVASIQVFRDTAYESGNASILKADQVVKDALASAPLLNQSAANIAAGTFSLPEYLTDGYITPRQVMESVNALENYRLKISGADLRTLLYAAKPTAPIAEVGEWSGAQFQDATVSGEEIYNKAVVDGTGPDGARLVALRSQANAATVYVNQQDSTHSGSQTGPVQADLISTNPSATYLPGGVFRAGVPYLITEVGGSVTNTGTTTWRIRIGGAAADDGASVPDDYVEFLVTVSGAGAQVMASQPPQTWIPRRNYVWLAAQYFLLTGTETAFTLAHKTERGPTLVDRRNFARTRRLDTSAAVTSPVAARLADLWLTEHNTSPFSGSLTVRGEGARRALGGQTIPPAEFLLYTGEKIRFSNRVDPDTGAWGRDGRIAGITYRHDDQVAEIAIDDQRKRFDTILSRYAVLVGG